MSVNAELIARIRKILAKTEEAGCTQAEAEAAFGLASSLMARHNLDMAEVEQAAGLDGEGWTETIVHESGRASSVNDLVAGLCVGFFFVQAIRFNKPLGRKNRVVQSFFGSPTNVETARFFFSALLAAIDRLWADAFRDGLFHRADRRLFALGVIKGYKEKLREERASMINIRDMATGNIGTALALQSIHEKTKLAFCSKHSDIRTLRNPTFYGSEESFNAGLEAGRKLNLSRPLAGSGSQRALSQK